MIIVSDSGPLAYLVEIGIAEALPRLYGQVYVPPTVISELRHKDSPVVAWANQPPGWLAIEMPASLPADLNLDQGECEAIALAIELSANYLLIDEKKGRAAAKGCGLKVVGTLAVLVDGARRGFFDGMQALEKLEATNFYPPQNYCKLSARSLNHERAFRRSESRTLVSLASAETGLADCTPPA